MKTRKILQLPALILALALADATRSQAVIFTWNTDTSTAFDVVITGTGQWIGSIDSPNGHWDVGVAAWMASNNPIQGECSISDGGTRTTYLGTIDRIVDPYENLEGYSDIFSESGLVSDHDRFYRTDAPTMLWEGYAPITIPSMPNKNDASTWTWTEEISGQLF